MGLRLRADCLRMEPEVTSGTVTCIIPVYNHPEYLSEALDSVLNQDIQDWHVIVVDDCSPDSGVSALQTKYSEERIRWIRHEKNMGPGAARNTGLVAASTKLVMTLDSDDLLEPSALRILREEFLRNPELDCAFCDFQFFGSETHIHHFEELGAERLAVTQWLPAQVMMKRSLWVRTGGYCADDALRGNEDWDFWISAAEKGFRWSHLSTPLYRYRRHPGSVSLQMPKYDHLGRKALLRRHAEFIRKHGDPGHFVSQGYLRAGRRYLAERSRFRAIGFGCCAVLHKFNEENRMFLRRAVSELIFRR